MPQNEIKGKVAFSQHTLYEQSINMFYLPTCNACESFLPEWSKMNAEISTINPKVQVNSIDCSLDVNSTICKDVKYVPHIMMSSGDSVFKEHKGNRTSGDLVTSAENHTVGCIQDTSKCVQPSKLTSEYYTYSSPDRTKLEIETQMETELTEAKLKFNIPVDVNLISGMHDYVRDIVDSGFRSAYMEHKVRHRLTNVDKVECGSEAEDFYKRASSVSSTGNLDVSKLREISDSMFPEGGVCGTVLSTLIDDYETKSVYKCLGDRSYCSIRELDIMSEVDALPPYKVSQAVAEGVNSIESVKHAVLDMRGYLERKLLLEAQRSRVK